MSFKHIPDPRLVQLVIEGTGADYAKVSEAILNKDNVMLEGLTIGSTTFYGCIGGLNADLLDSTGEDEYKWKWRIYIQLLPRVRRTGHGEAFVEVDAVTMEISTDLPVVKAYNEARRKAQSTQN